jgi:hypothetical protein
MGSSKDLLKIHIWIRDGVLPDPVNTLEARELATAAARQGLIAWLDDAMPAATDAWPQDVRRDVRDAHRNALVQGIRRLALARHTQRILAQRGLRSLALKGAALVETHYASPAHRPMADVDVLVLEHAEEARRALTEVGFREHTVGDHAWALTDPESGGTLELHHSLTSCPGLFPLDADGSWRDRIETPSGLHVASPERLLVQLALHAAFQHGLALSLVQYMDFRRVLECPLDVDRLQEVAHAAGAREALRLALDAAHVMVGAPVAGTLEVMMRGRRPAWLARRLQTPTECLDPEGAALIQARWTVARGRRLALLRGTLLSRTPSSAGSWWRRGVAPISRALRLARWAWRSAR